MFYHIAFFITVGTFLTPLLVDLNSYIFPFIVLKVFVFRSLVVLLAGVYAMLWYKERERFRPYMTPLHWAILAFWLVYVVTSLHAVDVRRALWDNHERMLGLVTVSHVVLYAFLVSWIFRTKKEIVDLWKYFLVAGSFVMFVGALQMYGEEPVLMSRGGRVYGTLGNPIYFSAYGLFLFFSGILCAYWHKQHVIWRSICVVASLLGFFGVFWGGTRGTLLGLMGGVVVSSLLYGVYNPIKEHRKYAWSVLGVGLLLLASLFVWRQTQFVQSIPAVGRLVNTSLSFDTSDTRLMAWKVGLQGWQEKPFLGWGPNGFFFAFNQYFNPRFLTYGYGETWFDNAHNVLVNTLTTQGIFGFIVYIGLFGTVVWSLWYVYQKNKDDLLVVSLFAGFLIGHFINNLFVFESPTSYLYFFFFLSCIAVWFRQYSSVEKAGASQPHRTVPLSFVVICSIIVFFCIWVVNVNPARANRYTLRVMALLNSGRASEAIELYEGVVQHIPTPHKDDVRSDISRTIAMSVNDSRLSATMSSDLKKQLTDIAYQQISLNIREYPYDIRHHLSFVQMAQSVMLNYSQPVPLLQNSLKYIDDALALSPTRQQLFFSKGSLLAQLGDTAQATQWYKKGVDLDNTVQESWKQYLRFLQITQQQDLYTQAVEEVRGIGGVFTPSDIESYASFSF
jgi:O-antigen ligase